MVILLGLAVLLASLSQLEALDNGLARTPPMGWLAWERFTCDIDCNNYPDECINSHLFETMAERMVSDGYQEAGYEYVNIDDCWSEKVRDNETEELIADRERFPQGIQALADKVHQMGLKLGIYGDCGTLTCAGYPAQLKSERNYEDNHFQQDAASLAKWGIDSFKFDGCYIDPLKAESICPKMSLALKATKRPVLLTCEWPFYQMKVPNANLPNFVLASQACNAWRYFDDVEDSWLSILSIIDFTVKMQNIILAHHGPGGWFDPDMLVIGNFGLSLDQAKAQMAIWSIWSAPLFMSNDLRTIKPDMAKVLLNKELIKVNQDRLGVFGLMVNQTSDKSVQAFVKPIEIIKNSCPSFAIVYLNRQTLGGSREISMPLRDLLAASGIPMAAKRYVQIYQNYRPGGEFDSTKCIRRLRKAMTKEPTPTELLIKPSGRENTMALEESKVTYEMYDLIDNVSLGRINLNESLKLQVNPSGVRAVRLVEVV